MSALGPPAPGPEATFLLEQAELVPEFGLNRVRRGSFKPERVDAAAAAHFRHVKSSGCVLHEGRDRKVVLRPLKVHPDVCQSPG